MNDALSRFELLVGDKISKIIESTILIIGIGGVGSYALEAVARCGVKNIILVDGDIIQSSNLNRQLLALHSNIGQKKVDVAKKRILDINPNAIVKTYDCFYNEETSVEILAHSIDFVIDAFDMITYKIHLIKECINRNIPIISSMGMANKFNPTLIEIENLFHTSYDKIAKIIRTKLKKEQINNKVMVVYSKEPAMKFKNQTERRILGSNSYVPSTAGLLCGYYAIHFLLEEKN